MDFFARFSGQITLRTTLLVILPPAVFLCTALLLGFVLDMTLMIALLLAWGASFIVVIYSSWMLVQSATKPIQLVQELLSYASNSAVQHTAPDPAKAKIGRELLEAMSRQIYSLATNQSAGNSANTSTNTDTIAATAEPIQTIQPAVEAVQSNILNELSTPILGINSAGVITIANTAAQEYLEQQVLLGKSLNEILHLSFQGDISLDQWLENTAKNSVTARQSWERVRHNKTEEDYKQFDLVASYSKDNSSGTELLLAFFDKTERYGLDDQEISLVALAVHELRTPLTIMRGYVEVFQDELGPSLTPELTDFMHKMQASTQQLTAFVGNILNVARVDENQLALKLREGNWAQILTKATQDLQLRAQVHGIKLELSIADNLPTVGVDEISANEIINNIVDNAIKYSNGADRIVISTRINDEGNVETSVQDFGIGIPTAVMGTLFQKYHRSHKSKTQVGGTGLGLYLCKALVGAHGGNIWVRSKEGEGSIFSFTLLPFSAVSAEQVEGEDGIVRGAHGWIKNHSLYRN